ncbi:class I SAM-dependent methyltransferase [Shouchella sp. 1P09AA]|uniref:class I SAM-dependent methyltransferase n=1 Tax=unclassified Shouchella TaxID=2893065 RepID=UPI0039A042FE
MTNHLFDYYVSEQNQFFSGWDFSHLSKLGRFGSSLLPWSYGSLALSMIKDSEAVLDMGTGGGEFFSRLQPFPKIVYATEGYAPNLEIARNRLKPLGVHVVSFEDDRHIPLPTNTFDLILNQHDSFCVKELARLLKKGGTFLTQQVGGLDCRDLNAALGADIDQTYSGWNLSSALNMFSKTSLEIDDAQEHVGTQRFYDVGAVIYYLHAIPWQVPDFSVQTYEHSLRKIHERIEQCGYIDFTQHRFLIKATRT